MTEEQIKQNAEAYADEHMVRTDGGGWEEEYDYEEQKAAYIAGAHSRDEEIAELKEEIESLKENEKELFEGFKKRGTKLGELMKENVKLRNPWISVEDRLPEENKNVFVMFGDTDIIGVGYLADDVEECWQVYGWGCISKVTHWMPIPELKKGKQYGSK